MKAALCSLIVIATVDNCQPQLPPKNGQTVTIESGCYKGLTGIVVHANNKFVDIDIGGGQIVRKTKLSLAYQQ